MADTLLAEIPRNRLSVVLTAMHRGGYGSVTRVLDPERAPIADQLRRAGIEATRMGATPLEDAVLLVVNAQGRTALAASLAVANGAVEAEVVTRGLTVSDSVAPGLITFAGSRRGRRSTRGAAAPVQMPPEFAAD